MMVVTLTIEDEAVCEEYRDVDPTLVLEDIAYGRLDRFVVKTEVRFEEGGR